MPVETLGEAFDRSWSVHMRCLHDGKEGLKHRRDCNFRCELDLETLVCTRGGRSRLDGWPSAYGARAAAAGGSR